MTTKLLKVAAAGAAISLMLPVLAFAQIGAGINTNVNAHVRATLTASTTAETTRAAGAKEKANKEIDRRIASLTALLARIEQMTKVTAELKANIKSTVQAQIDGLVQLNAKIDADTDLATLKADVKMVTDSYRIYVLVMPQVRIAAATDRMITIVNMMNSVGVKLTARVNTAKAAGADTAALDAALTDLASRLTSVQAHAQAGFNLVAPLVPDQGDKTVMASNEAEIKKAQAEIKAGQADLVAARKDIAVVVGGLAKLKTNANANSNASTTLKTQ